MSLEQNQNARLLFISLGDVLLFGFCAFCAVDYRFNLSLQLHHLRIQATGLASLGF